MCQVQPWVGTAARSRALFRDHARSTTPESEEDLSPWRTVCAALRSFVSFPGAEEDLNPWRSLSEALRSFVSIPEVGEECASPRRRAAERGRATDVAQLLRCARAKLEEQLDEGEATVTADTSREAALQLLAADVPSRLVVCLGALDFEAKKDAIRLFEALLRLGMLLDVGEKIIEYVKSHPDILQLLLEGAGSPEVAWQCAQMIRNCAWSPQLVEALLEKGAVTRLMELAQHESFDISSEAFSCLKELILEQKEVSAAFLEAHFEEFFGKLHAWLQDEDYVRQRQALKLVGEILLDRSFMQVMLAYVRSEQFLQIHMNLLRHSSKVIQTDAFHVFKAFVGNPSKPRRVQQILYQNKDKLVQYLATFYTRHEDDDAFLDDLDTVIQLIKSLEPPPRRSASASLLR